MRQSIVPVFLVLLLLGFVPASSQDPKIDPGQRFLLLATSATETMRMELDKAAAQGFRIVAGSSRGNSEIVLVLERKGKPAESVDYKLVATTETPTFQKEVSELAAQGYRAVPRTFITKPHVMAGPEIVVIMERSPNSAKRYDYLLLATTLTSTLEKEWAEAAGQGYQLVGMLTRAELMVLLEKEAAGRPSARNQGVSDNQPIS